MGTDEQLTKWAYCAFDYIIIIVKLMLGLRCHILPAIRYMLSLAYHLSRKHSMTTDWYVAEYWNLVALLPTLWILRNIRT